MFDGLKIREDPEAIFQEGRFFCDVGEYQLGLDLLRRAISKGYWPLATLQGSHEFDSVRDDAACQRLSADAAAARDGALKAFCDAGGERLLGLQQSSVRL